MISFFLPYIGNLQQAARTFNCLTLFLVLGSCANVAPRAIENVIWDQQRMLLEDLGAWQLRGRVNVAYKDENDTQSIRLQKQDTTYKLPIKLNRNQNSKLSNLTLGILIQNSGFR